MLNTVKKQNKKQKHQKIPSVGGFVVFHTTSMFSQIYQIHGQVKAHGPSVNVMIYALFTKSCWKLPIMPI